jgi:hypothetical protein
MLAVVHLRIHTGTGGAMNSRRIAAQLALTCLTVAVLGDLPLSRAVANGHSEPGQTVARYQGGPAGLIKVVREATERFKDVASAEAEGYSLMFGCVSGPDSGAMGLHFVNLPLVVDGVLDPAKPEIIIYEPLPNGRLRMIGADFLVFAQDWHQNNAATPELMGQLLHLFESPNRFGLPDFYTLHVWAWKDNPTGAFVNWHSNVSCDAFKPGNR